MTSDYNQSFNTIFRWQFLSTVFITLIQLATIVLLGRFLEYKELGSFALFQLIFRFALYSLEPGMFFSLIQKHESSQQLVKRLFLWQSLYIITAIVSLFFLVYTTTSLNELQGTLLINCFVILVIIGFGAYLQSILIQNFQQKEIAIAQVAGYASELILVIFFCGLYNPVLVFSFGIIIRFLVFYSICLFYYVTNKSNSNFEQHEANIVEHTKQSNYNIASQVLSYFQGQYDTFIIISLFGLSTLGGYILTTEISYVIFSKINPLFNKAIIPVVSKTMKDNVSSSEIIKESFTNYLFIILLCYCGLWVFRAEIFTIAYPDKFIELSYYAAYLLPIALCKAINNIMNSYILAIGEARKIFYWNIILLIANYTVFYFFYTYRYSLDTFLKFSLIYSLLSTIVVGLLLRRELNLKNIIWDGLYLKPLLNLILIIIALFVIHKYIINSWLAFILATISTLSLLYFLEKKRILSWLKLTVI